MRIAQLTSRWLPTGGVATYVRLLSRALASTGHDVCVVHGETGSDEHPERGNIAVSACPGAFQAGAGETGKGSAGVAVQARLSEFAPDVVHLHGTNNFPLETAILNRYPSVKTVHVFDFCPSGTKYHHRLERACVEPTSWKCVPWQVTRRCTLSRRPNVIWSQYTHAVESNAVQRRFHATIVASDYVKREAVRTGFDGGRIDVLPYFTTLPDRTTGEPSRDVLFVGRVMREKGADLLIEAMASIPTPWRCVIAGDGMDMPAVRQRALDLGVADRVVFAGWLTGAALEAAYRRAALIVVPSRWPEPFGIIGIEAFAFEKPVVAFNVGGIAEWLDDGESGFLIRPHDARAMGERVAFLLDHPDVAARMGAHGRARVERDFIEAPHLARLMPIYERVRTQHAQRTH